MQNDTMSRPSRMSLFTSARTTNAFSVPSSCARRLTSAMDCSVLLCGNLTIPPRERREEKMPGSGPQQPIAQGQINLRRALQCRQVTALLDHDQPRGADQPNELLMHVQRRQRVFAPAQDQRRTFDARQLTTKVGARNDRLLATQVRLDADAVRHLADHA